MLARKTTIRAAPALRRMKTPMIAVSRCFSSRLFGVVGPDQAVAVGLYAFHALEHAVPVDRMPEHDDRQLRAQDPVDGAVELLSRLEGRRLAGVVQQQVHARRGPAEVVQRPLRVDELVDVAVWVDTAGPADREGVVLSAVLPR